MPSSSRSAAGETLPGLGQRLLWITAFRTIATTLLLVVLTTRLVARPPELITSDDSRSFAWIGLVYLLCLAYALPLRRRTPQAWWAYVQIAGDIALATFMIAQTGGLESPFSFIYLLAVLAGAILLGRKGAVFAFTLASLVLVGRTLLLQADIGLSWLGAEVRPSSRMLFLLLSNLLAQFLIAWLASYLADQLLRTGGRLVAREADLHALATLQKQILDAMPSGLVTCRPDGSVRYLNRAAAGILAVTGGTEGVQIESLIPGVLDIPLSSRRNELTVPTAVGTKVLGLSLTRLDPPESDLLVVFQDLTALRRTEDALRQADHLAALGRLSAQLAHEIRNPLAAMRGSAQLLADDASKAGESGRLPGILIRESDRLGALLDDFLRFARPAAPNRQRTALHELIGQVLEMFRGDPLAREVKLVEELSPTQGFVDPDQLRQVVLNLLRNACSAARPGGTVKVGVEGSAACARVRVWDSAGAIAAEDLPRLFEPFFTKRPGGTGLGLSTTHSIVHAHGGTIEVSSSRQDGTEFVIALPSVSAEESVDPDRR